MASQKPGGSSKKIGRHARKPCNVRYTNRNGTGKKKKDRDHTTNEAGRQVMASAPPYFGHGDRGYDCIGKGYEHGVLHISPTTHYMMDARVIEGVIMPELIRNLTLPAKRALLGSNHPDAKCRPMQKVGPRRPAKDVQELKRIMKERTISQLGTLGVKVVG